MTGCSVFNTLHETFRTLWNCSTTRLLYNGYQ